MKTSAPANWNDGLRAATELALDIDKIVRREQVLTLKSKSDKVAGGCKFSKWVSRKSASQMSL